MLTQEAGETRCPKEKSQQTVEQLMVSRGGVIWPQLLPGDTRGGIAGQAYGSTGGGNDGNDKTPLADTRQAFSSERPHTFSMVEDRLLCR